MIGAGKDRGDMGSSNKKAIDVLVSFEPQFILEMSKRELHEWCQRAAARSTAHTKHSREPSAIDNPFLTKEDRDWGGIDNASLIINLLSVLLYTINYYIISPTANHYAILLGTDGAYGATLIGGEFKWHIDCDYHYFISIFTLILCAQQHLLSQRCFQPSCIRYGIHVSHFVPR